MMKNETDLTKKRGYKFYFQADDNQIACFGSYFSGKEEVYINDELVSSKRNFGFKSVHELELEGTKYRVIYDIINPFIGKVECSFLKGRKSIATQSQSLFSDNPKAGASIVLWCFIIGFTFGALGYTFAHFLFGWK
ncbi:MAG: hypothetical protein ACI9LE_000687 [Paraglaciecola sp.]|jgi:hypothetical protein